MRVWLAVLGSILLASPIRPAAAQAAPAAQPAPAVDKAKSKVAKRYVDAGLAAQSTGDYDTAITFYGKAYQLVAHPVLLFNMAQAHRLSGRIDEALKLYAQYLEQAPNGAQAQTARDLIAEEKARRAEAARALEATRKADEDRKTEVARVEQARRDREAAQARVTKPEDASAPVVEETVEVARPGAGRTLRLLGITTGAVGVVGLAVGIGYGVHGSSLSSEVSKRYDPEKVKAGDRANTLQAVGLVTGGVLVVAGAALYWRGWARDRHERVTVTPLVTDHGAGLAIAGWLP